MALGAKSWPVVFQSICFEINQLLVAGNSKNTENSLAQCFQILNRAERDGLLPHHLVEQKLNLEERWSETRKLAYTEPCPVSSAFTPKAWHAKSDSNSSARTYSTMDSPTYSSPKSGHSSSPSVSTYQGSPEAKSPQNEPLSTDKNPTSFQKAACDFNSVSLRLELSEVVQKKYKVKLVSVAVPLVHDMSRSDIRTVEDKTSPVKHGQNELDTTISNDDHPWNFESFSNPDFIPVISTPTNETVRMKATCQPSKIPVPKSRPLSRAVSRCSSRASSIGGESRYIKQKKLVVRVPTRSATPDPENPHSASAGVANRSLSALAHRSKVVSHVGDGRITPGINNNINGDFQRSTSQNHQARAARRTSCSRSSSPNPHGRTLATQRNLRPRRSFSISTHSSQSDHESPTRRDSLPIYARFKSKIPIPSSASRSHGRRTSSFNTDSLTLEGQLNGVTENPSTPSQASNLKSTPNHSFNAVAVSRAYTVDPTLQSPLEVNHPKRTKSSLDRTPSHTEYRRRSSKPLLREEIRRYQDLLHLHEKIPSLPPLSILEQHLNSPPKVGRYGLKLSNRD